MNKSDFIAAIAVKLDSTKAEATRNVEAVIAVMTEVFKEKDSLTLPGFGTLGTKKRAAKTGRNPGTGKTIQIPEAIVPYMRISSKIKDLINYSGSTIVGKKVSREVIK